MYDDYRKRVGKPMTMGNKKPVDARFRQRKKSKMSAYQNYRNKKSMMGQRSNFLGM